MPSAIPMFAAWRGIERLRQLLQAKFEPWSIVLSLFMICDLALGWYLAPGLYRSLGITALLPSLEIRLALYCITLAELLKRRQRLVAIVKSVFLYVE